jgi:predicted Zn finger-like uncharacterized protein
MRFVCDSCRAQYMISDEKVGAKGVKVRCKKCGFVILVRRTVTAETQAMPSLPEEGATQVINNPLEGGAPPEDPELTNPGEPAAGQNQIFSGVEEDEIGAVFDQVLSTGSHKAADGEQGGDEQQEPPALGDELDERMSTRVLDADVVRKLAEEAAAAGTPLYDDEGHAGQNGAEAPEVHNDWYVAVEEKQIGPLSFTQVKDRWEKGEIGPDSLCWRAGFSDWIPLSDVSELGKLLAPQPRKPVIVAPEPMAPVMTVPVESAFNAGGVSRVVRTEVPVMAAASSATTGVGGWKPSAASALASLVKEEIEALTKPPPPTPEVEVPPSPVAMGAGILDIPSEVHPVPEVNGRSRTPQPRSVSGEGTVPVGAPYAPYGTPYGGYQPGAGQGGSRNKMLFIGGGAALLVVFVLLGVVVWAVTKVSSQQQQVVIQQPASAPLAQAQVPTAPGQPTAPAAEAQPAQAAAQPPAPAAEPTKAAEPPGTEAAAAKAPERAETTVARAESPTRRDSGRTERTTTTARREEPVREPAPTRSPSPPADDFDAVFGSSSSSKSADTGSSGAKKPTVYVPPPPGATTVQESLGQSDIMQVVLANRGAIQKCAADAKAKDPSINGQTLVMRWTILTSGKTSSVSAQTAELKSNPVAGCIGGLIKGWTFPRHQKQGPPIDFPFKL